MPLPIIVWDNGIQLFLSSDFKKVEVKEVTAPDSTITFVPLSESDSVAKESTDYLYESKSSNYSIFHGKIVAAKHGDMLLKLNSDGKKKLVSHSSLIDFSITKNVLMTLLICGLIFFLLQAYQSLTRRGQSLVVLVGC